MLFWTTLVALLPILAWMAGSLIMARPEEGLADSERWNPELPLEEDKELLDPPFEAILLRL